MLGGQSQAVNASQLSHESLPTGQEKAVRFLVGLEMVSGPLE